MNGIIRTTSIVVDANIIVFIHHAKIRRKEDKKKNLN
jgi:hypothetical protein